MSTPNENIVGSLADKQPAKAGMGQWLIVSGVAAAVVGLIMRLVARSQIGKAELLQMFGSYQAEEAIRNATTLGNVGLAFLIIGGALAFLGVVAIIARR
jgi:hypothetical protein